MTSSNSTSPSEDKLRVIDGWIRNESRSASPTSSHASSPECVTKQNQLLQPFVLNVPSRASSDDNLAEGEEKSSLGQSSRSESVYTHEEEISQEMTQLKGANSKRIGWVKLIRLQLNALHEKKYKSVSSAMAVGEKPLLENKLSESDTPNDNPENQGYPWSTPVDELSHPSGSSDTFQRLSMPRLVDNNAPNPSLRDVDLKNMNSIGTLKKKTTNVKGKISQFWRQAAAAALRHQKQSECLVNEKPQSSSPTSSSPDIEKAAVQRTLENLFQVSWPTSQQVSRWQYSFQNLLQDERGLQVFREFLQSEFSDENLEFWIACQKYKTLSNKSLQRPRAQEIYDSFIAFQSQREVNLDCETRIQTEMRLSHAEPDLFDASQKRIEALMEKDPYRRFLRSNLFLKLLEICQKREKSSLSNTEAGSGRSSFSLSEQKPDSTTNEPSSQACLCKTTPSKSVDCGDLRIVSLRWPNPD